MKKSHLYLFLGALFGLCIIIAACNNSTNKTSDSELTEEEVTQEGEALAETLADADSPEYASAFICSMHCKGSGSHEAGKCPGCGMDYQKNENYVSGKTELQEEDLGEDTEIEADGQLEAKDQN